MNLSKIRTSDVGSQAAFVQWANDYAENKGNLVAKRTLAIRSTAHCNFNDLHFITDMLRYFPSFARLYIYYLKLIIVYCPFYQTNNKN